MFKNNGAYLAVRSTSWPFNPIEDGALGMSRAELDKIIKEGINDSELRVIKRVFIIPRDCDYANVSDDILKKLVFAVAASPQKNQSL